MGERLSEWLRSPQVWRGLLVTAAVAGCFLWAMVFVGLSFAMVERGAQQWWLMPVFGLLMAVVAIAAARAVLALPRQATALTVPEPGGAESPDDAAASLDDADAAREAGAQQAGDAVSPEALGSEELAASRVLVEPLSSRELEVLEQLAAGRSNKEIARALFVAPGTIKAHLNHIFRKLDAASRLQAVAHAREAGLLRDEINRA